MTPEPAKLTPKQQRAITALLSSTTLAQAAKACGLSERSLSRYMSLPHFRQALAQAEGEAMADAARLLARVATASVAVLSGIMADGSQPGVVRVNAAKSLLQIAVTFRQHTDLEERLARLEESIEQNSK